MDFTKIFMLPPVASAHGQEVDMIIYLVHLLMFVLFFGWGAFFIYTLIRFNRRMNPKANYHGMHSHVSTFLEVGVALFEGLLLVGFSIPLWSKYVSAFPERPDKVEVRVVAEQFAWNIHYPGPDGVFGATDYSFYNKETNPLGLDPNDPHGKDDVTTINQLHLPLGRQALIHVSSKDVIHSFSLPIMRVKQDAIPGMSIPVAFVPTKSGQSEIVCAQLCGLGHYRMQGFLTVETEDKFNAWLESQAAPAGDEGYDDFWN